MNVEHGAFPMGARQRRRGQDGREQRGRVPHVGDHNLRSLSDVTELGTDDELDGADVLPGFRCRLKEPL